MIGKTIITALTFLATIALANAQSWQPPAASERCPSPWGQGDERGHGNLLGPETVLRATQLIRKGELIELSDGVYVLLNPAGVETGDAGDVIASPSSRRAC